MSVIVAKSAVCCGTGSTSTTVDCFPAIAIQRIVPVGSTLTIDGVGIGAFRAAQWLVVVSNGDASRVRSYQVYATHRNGINPTFGIRAVLGDSILHTPNVIVSGGLMSLTVANSDTEDLIVYVTRMGIPLFNSITNVLDVVDIGQSRALVRAGQTASLDIVSPSEMVAVTWIVSGVSSTGARFACQLYAQLINDVVVTHYATTGNPALTHNVLITDVTGLGVELALQNTSSSDMRLSMVRIPVQIGSILPYCGKGSGIDLWIPGGVAIAPGTTATVDTAALPAHAGVKWLFGAIEDTTNRTMCTEINATNPTPTTATYVHFGIVGDFLLLDINTSVSGGNLLLTVKNNEANVVNVNLLRVPTPA